MPIVSIAIPTYNMGDGGYFIKRALDSINRQTFKDYEVVVSDNSDDHEIEEIVKAYPKVEYYRNRKKGMANNTNHAIDNSVGDIVKILYQDDYFLETDSLHDILDTFYKESIMWVATACLHEHKGQLFNLHYPNYSDEENTIGSPSVIAFRRSIKERFDPQFSWVLDLDFYRRLNKLYGQPRLLHKPVIGIGIHDKQMTQILTDAEKDKEVKLLNKKKYG